MADFKIAHKITEKFEGGYANDSKDTGGETWRGIARNYWPKLSMWLSIDGLVPVKPTKWDREVFAAINAKLWASQEVNKGVDAFYETNFWDSVGLDGINSQEVANMLFDISVNMGSGRATKFLQQSAGVLQDGKIGPKTLSTANSIKPELLYNDILQLRKSKYDDIITANPSQIKFKSSWYSRLVPFERSNPQLA